MDFRMTAQAARELLAAAGRSGAEGMALRVAARPTRQGLGFALGFDEPASGDTVTVVEGLTVLVGPDCQRWLAGSVLDFVELDDGAGRDFVLVPPAQAGGCGSGAAVCGSGRCGSCG